MISFVDERKAFKLIANDKVEIMSEWEEKAFFSNGKCVRHPAIIRLTYHVKWQPKRIRFNRYALLRRDNFTCCYCGLALLPHEATIDHVIPKYSGGPNNWLNCVTCCKQCNLFKGNRTPEKADMKLLSVPFCPTTINKTSEYINISPKHSDWEMYCIRR